MNRLRLLFTACAVALAVTANAAPGLAGPASPGLYKTNYGNLALYAANPGHIAGTYYYKGLPAHLFLADANNGFYEGVWVQATSEVKCAKTHNGSPYWGRVRARFEGGRMLALWNYCARTFVNEKEHRWMGQKVN